MPEGLYGKGMQAVAQRQPAAQEPATTRMPAGAKEGGKPTKEVESEGSEDDSLEQEGTSEEEQQQQQQEGQERVEEGSERDDALSEQEGASEEEQQQQQEPGHGFEPGQLGAYVGEDPATTRVSKLSLVCLHNNNVAEHL